MTDQVLGEAELAIARCAYAAADAATLRTACG
jgi:hypothetical protein